MIATADDYRELARRRLPTSVFDFVDGGAGDESSVASNLAGFGRVTFRPRPLVDVSQRDLHVNLFGTRVELPVLLAPAGGTRLIHRYGELAVARAAARMGTIYVLSVASNFALEDVASVARGSMLWFQLYLWQDRKIVADLVRRAAKAGFQALCVTVDTPTSGLRERDLRNGFTIPLRIDARFAIDACTHPRWTAGYISASASRFKNLEPYGLGTNRNVVGLTKLIQNRLHDASATWDDLSWVRKLWHGPLVVKGVHTAEAAAAAFSSGADAVVCSNHGGRQLSGAPASIDALPEVAKVAKALNKHVLLDGGVRRGHDIVKSIALGAAACLVGRPYHWGLAVDGENGVVRVLEMYKREVDNVLA